jgi:hypothetical protein
MLQSIFQPRLKATESMPGVHLPCPSMPILFPIFYIEVFIRPWPMWIFSKVLQEWLPPAWSSLELEPHQRGRHHRASSLHPVSHATSQLPLCYHRTWNQEQCAFYPPHSYVKPPIRTVPCRALGPLQHYALVLQPLHDLLSLLPFCAPSLLSSDTGLDSQ